MLERFAFVFPGQGSQFLGMLSDIAKRNPLIQETFAEATEALGYDLWNLTQIGPAEKLNQTEYTQPALLTAGVALWRLWAKNKDKEERPSLLAGHSLGEYTALVCAESLTLEAGVRLVALRGKAMQEAVPAGMGAMAAILGLSDEEVQKVCGEVSTEQNQVTPANYNSLGQVVIAGHTSAIQAAIVLAKEKGAKRAILLPVSVPSHCGLMLPAAEQLSRALETVSFKSPSLPILHNVDVQEHKTVAAIKKALIEQLYQPVRWVETIQAIAKRGVEAIYECGPGAVLSGLNKRIVQNVRCETLLCGEALCL